MEHKSYEAAYKGDIKHVRDINEQLNLIVTPKKNTILHVNIGFSRQPSSNFVKQVLEICPPLLIQVNDSGDTPLHLAAKKGRLDIVKVLIKHAKARPKDLEGKVIVVEEMLRMKNNDGNTALHKAAQNHNSVDVVKLLMREDRNFQQDSTNNCGETPLYVAASTGSLKVVVEMLQTCTSATYKCKGPHGFTILHAAVWRNHPGITRKILEKKSWVTQTNEDGLNLTKEKDENGWTPLHYAAYYDHYSIVKLLVKFNASAACIADTCRNMTALHLAAGQGHFHTARIIIVSCPASLEQVDNRGWNYIHFDICNVATSFGLRRRQHYWEDCLLEAKDVRGNTPLLVLASITQREFHMIEKRVGRELMESTIQSIYNHKEQFRLLKKEVLELSEVRDQPYKLGVVCLPYKRYGEFDDSLEKYRDMYLVVNTLIATVTFTAGLTLPGGYVQEGANAGTPILIRDVSFQVFLMADAVALALSIFAVLLQIFLLYFGLKKHDIRRIHFACYSFTIVALGGMLLAFVTGTRAMLRHSSLFVGFPILIFLISLTIPPFYMMRKIYHSKAVGKAGFDED